MPFPASSLHRSSVCVAFPLPSSPSRVISFRSCVFPEWKNARTSFAFPQDIFPSGQMPRRQPGPAFAKRCGATLRTKNSICVATSRISHCARLQQRNAKKFWSDRALNVQTIFVSQAFGSTKRASSIARFSAARAASFSLFPSSSRAFRCFSIKAPSSAHSAGDPLPWPPEILLSPPGSLRSPAGPHRQNRSPRHNAGSAR